MTSLPDTPTQEIYSAIEHCYRHFNKELFGGELPHCLITLQRQPRMMGYVMPKRWVNSSGEHTDELAVNPEYFLGSPLAEICQVMVHEQCHVWQNHFGTPGRRGYHNKEWANKMRTLGLVASDTGQPGGKETGEKMGDYILYGGPFWQAYLELIQREFSLPWLDTFPALPPHQRIALYNEYGDLVDQSGAVLSSKKVLQRNIVSIEHIAGGKLLESVEDSASDLSAASKDNTDVSTSSSLVAFPTVARKPTRSKYRCPCGNQVWGKPQLALICGSCSKQYEQIEG